MAIVTPPPRIGKTTGAPMPPPNATKRKRLAKAGKANVDGSYPTDTPGRAVAAKGRATQAVKAGRMGTAEKSRIDARANRELGTKPGLINQ
jgi:hypothetical protein